MTSQFNALIRVIHLVRVFLNGTTFIGGLKLFTFIDQFLKLFVYKLLLSAKAHSRTSKRNKAFSHIADLFGLKF